MSSASIRRARRGVAGAVVLTVLATGLVAVPGATAAGADVPDVRASTAGQRAPDAATRAVPALRVGGVDRYFDDFLRPKAGPGLLPLVAGTRIDLELRWRASAPVRGGTLRVLLPSAFAIDDVRPVRAVPGYGTVGWDVRGAFTVRPAASFESGYRPPGACRPVPGPGVPQTATRTAAGWRLTVPGVTCRRGEVLRLRITAVRMPATPRTVPVPWSLRAPAAARLPGGDVAPPVLDRGRALATVVAPSSSRLEVTAPATYQLVRNVVDGVPQISVSAEPISATVRVLTPGGTPDTGWTGWVTVVADIERRAYDMPCDAFPVAVRIGPADDGVVTVPGLTPIRDVANTVNAWAMDHGLEPGSSAPVQPLPPVDGLPYEPSTICPISYHLVAPGP